MRATYLANDMVCGVHVEFRHVITLRTSAGRAHVNERVFYRWSSEVDFSLISSVVAVDGAGLDLNDVHQLLSAFWQDGCC